MVVDLITTHKNVSMTVTIMQAGVMLLMGFEEDNKPSKAMVVRQGEKGFAPFGVKMLGGREATIHIENDRIVVKNANRNIEVKEFKCPDSWGKVTA